jgi:thymidine kinase
LLFEAGIVTRLVGIETSYCFNCPTNICCVSFLATNEDKPTHDVVLVDEAPFFGRRSNNDTQSITQTTNDRE